MIVAVRAVLLGVAILSLAGCGGGGSSSGAETTVTVTTETTTTDPITQTDTTSTSSAVDVGETATWRGDTFTVSEVKTSDTAPAADILGEFPEAENGIWLSFKVTPAEDDSGIWSSEFVENMQVKGGDGVVYDDGLHNNGGEQDFNDEGDFLVWVDVPEAAVAGAVLEVYDGVHTIDPDPSNPYSEPVPDPAYATRVNLGS